MVDKGKEGTIDFSHLFVQNHLINHFEILLWSDQYIYRNNYSWFKASSIPRYFDIIPDFEVGGVSW